MIKLAEFVLDKQLAKLLRVSVDVIRSHRKEKRGLSFYRFGRSIKYSLNDIHEYIERNKVNHMSKNNKSIETAVELC